ncbi:MAG TPA: MarR family transcriptional regulator [Solirubrobacteraceae bacterium]|jgi:DNA-binding MarR family transcriptional regulator|nr:MarR family transcriptional regulator [Solirubrobacteraceae bacterium]
MSSDKRALFGQLVAEVRRAQAATARFDRAVAEVAGLNLTDMGCLDILGQEGPLTAGQLAERTGLSSGAMTTAIDRLESAGFARRTRDAGDRRRVVVALTDKVNSLNQYYDEHVELGERLYGQYTAEQMRLLLGFVRQGRELDERRAADLELVVRNRRDAR